MAANFSESVRFGKEREGWPATAADVSAKRRKAIARRPLDRIIILLEPPNRYCS